MDFSLAPFPSQFFGSLNDLNLQLSSSPSWCLHCSRPQRAMRHCPMPSTPQARRSWGCTVLDIEVFVTNVIAGYWLLKTIEVAQYWCAICVRASVHCFGDVVEWWCDDVMVWWCDDVMVWCCDDVMVWWCDDVMTWWRDDVMMWWCMLITRWAYLNSRPLPNPSTPQARSFYGCTVLVAIGVLFVIKMRHWWLLRYCLLFKMRHWWLLGYCYWSIGWLLGNCLLLKWGIGGYWGIVCY